MAAGGNHTIILAESGRAYWSGDSSKGACGVTTISTADNAQFEQLILAKSETLGPIAHIACTWDSTTCVVRDEQGKARKVYSCGTGEQGQLGFEVRGIVEPKLIPDFPPEGTEVMHLASGMAHVVAVLDNGDVYGWGNGRKGQLGQAVVLDDGAPPTPIINFAPCKIGDSSGVDFQVVNAVCGRYTTCLFGESTEGRVLVLGPDKWGLKSKAPSATPQWKTVDGSWGDIFVLGEDGSLTAWGRDEHGQLPPPNLPKITKFVAGSEHAVAVTDTNEVISWGWGEHGNCGPQTDGPSGVVKGRWNVIASGDFLPEDSQIAAIGAGCATSWIYIHAEGLHL
ncbi:alpha-tubulin suppressor protein aats1 [Apiospora marii]|uniref:Alpha-tubulin suppressor protein aats1 n=1 Tax=Apiospora marii TaxID=335849 RepID=A0ABR1S6T1_9PEZI